MASSTNVSSVSTFTMTVDEIIKHAFWECGLVGIGQDPPATEVVGAREILNRGLKALQAQGVILRTREVTTLSVSAGATSITFPTDTLNVASPFTWVPSSGSETEIEAMSASDYTLISNKDDEGTPTRLYVQEQATVTGYLHPLPSEAGSVRYTKERVMRDATEGTHTPDLLALWLDALVMGLAARIASNKRLPEAVIMRLQGQYEVLKNDAMGTEKESGGFIQFVLG